MRKRDILFALLTIVLLGAVVPSLYAFIKGARPSDYYSHIPLVPIISAYLIFRQKDTMFTGGATGHPLGILMMAIGGAGVLGGRLLSGADSRTMVITLAGVLFLTGSYLVIYGRTKKVPRLFPLTFLLFAVPIPAPIMDKVVSLLALGSTLMTRVIFSALSVPFIQEGAIFQLPGFSIEVAQECSSIRSSLALFITSVLAGHLLLKRYWAKGLLLFFVVPVAVFKNAIRIVTLTLLSGFFDMRIITGGFLHKSGGFIFFGLGLVVIGFILFIIKELETGRQGA